MDGSAPPGWPDWTGQTAVCIATGPSLEDWQVDAARASGARTIGINDIGLAHRWIDLWYAADYTFWQHHRAAMAGSAMTVCGDDAMLGRDFRTDLYVDVHDKVRGAAFERGYVLNGGHSGFQALCIAVSLGARRIVLLGYDCLPRDGKTNYFGRKCEALQRPSDYGSWPGHYRNLKLPAGVEVLNATPGSAIDAFPRVGLLEAL